MPPTKHVQRQIAVTVVIAVEEPPLLMSVQRIIRGIEVENDLLERCLEVRALPSTGVTRLPQYYGPVRLPPGPAPEARR
jgi:hypothetical protein